MRKYIIGAIAGAALMLGMQAGASGILDGAKVAGTKDVTFNHKVIGQAAIINNTSYLPVRSTADALRLNIDFEGGTINLTDGQQLTDGSTAPSDSTSSTSQQLTVDQINARLSEIDKQLTQNINLKNQSEEQIAFWNSQPNGEEYVKLHQNALSFANDQINKLTTEKADLEAQLQALQNQ